MTQFSANLKNELTKLLKRKKYLVFLIVAAVICIAGSMKTLIATAIIGLHVDRGVLFGNMAQGNLSAFMMIYLPLIAIMASADLYAQEWSDATIRFSLMRPVSREKIYFSKALAVFLLCAAEVLILYLFSSLVQIVVGGTASGIAAGLISCVLDLVPLAVLVLFFALINQGGFGSGPAVLLSIVCYIALWAAGTYIASVGGLLFTGYLCWHNLWVGTMIPFTAMISRIGILVGYALVIAAVGCILFRRREK